MDRPVGREEAGSWALVLSLLPFSQDDASYLSGSFPTAQAWGLHPAPGPECGAHTWSMISPNPTKYTEELAPVVTPVALKLHSAWTGGGRDAGHKGPGLIIPVWVPFSAASLGLSLAQHLCPATSWPKQVASR